MHRALLAISSLLFLASLSGYSAQQKAGESERYFEMIPGTNIKIEMVLLPAGTFAMGSPTSEAGRSEDEGPQHETRIRAFWMSTIEITWDQYDVFAFSMDLKKDRPQTTPATPTGVDAVTRPTPPYADESFGYGKGDQPVISVTHHAAMEFCRWLSVKTGKTYRLPTEAEWEYACRAEAKSAYSFGDGAKTLGEYAWYVANSNEGPHPVAKKKPNAWGLFDMHGNVAEWCLDHYDKNFYSQFKTLAVSPVLLPTENRYPHVARGGSWDDEALKLRCASRHGSNPSWSRRDPQSPQSIWWHTDATEVGFRIVRPVEEQENLKGLRSKVTKQSG